MNLSSFLGFLIAIAVLGIGVILPSANPAIFMDSHALILVCGGTLSAALISFPVSRILGLGKMFIFGVLFKSKADVQTIAMQIIQAAPLAERNPSFLKHARVEHPFLQEGLGLIAEGILSEDQLKDVLNQRSAYFKKNYLADAKILNSLAKFPPAFGLLGASTGMIAMMTNLGKGGPETIGPAMAIALVATFWGIALANFVLLPLADYATKAAQEDASLRDMICQGLIMLKRKESQKYILEKLNGFIPLNERFRMTENSFTDDVTELDLARESKKSA